ncbi:MAG: hypothetical protein HFH31_04640 [Bacilli bacterium]|nr:hypothetical protein [Bacilli bacterium]
MIKKFFQFFKRIIVSGFILYGFNIIVAPLNIMIPLNIITILALAILGIPALFSFLIILLLIY